jgi:uncharacterized protein (DUF1330 family)/quinol monooxygenase YgiN
MIALRKFIAFLSFPLGGLAGTPTLADTAFPPDVVVRVAELEIDPAQLEAYKAAVKEEMADSVRLEPGVIAIYSVAEKDNPARLRFFEIYASDAAYRSHIDSPHFRKYVEVTKPMIRSRKLLETKPVQLSAKEPPRQAAYYIAHFEPSDPDAIRPYSARVASTFEPFGGRFVVRGGRVAALEGEAPKGHTVMIEFDSMERARAWFDSPAYAQLKPIRHRAGNTRAYIVEGPPPALP